ncbi:MAG TPA: right-handed parallel beta-helix repeat-containing protein [Flavipsychrobacter sp.]|nr:right-handed parallel beta-helix repeat-containing protein [Flavipsychrobacter sp.]
MNQKINYLKQQFFRIGLHTTDNKKLGSFFLTGSLFAVLLSVITISNGYSQTTTCKGKRIYITKGSDNGKYINGSSFSYSPGDTLVLKSSANPYSYFSLEGVHGTASCPVVIINEGGQVQMTDGMAFSNCSYIKVRGTGSKDKYGFHIQDPSSNGVAVDIFGRSRNIEVCNVDIHQKTYGFWVKEEQSCIDSLQYPNWVISFISIHDNRIVKTNQEGMYLGSTDPNATRTITCSGKIIAPKPLRLENISVYNNIVDSTNRSGIQLSCASYGVNRIWNNHVTNCGFELSTAQGNGISLGGYTTATVYNNYIANTYALGIMVLGAGLINIDSNTIINSGKLAGHTVSGMDGIMVDTRYTNPVDSSQVHILNNKISSYTDYGIRFYRTYNTYGSNNIICENTGTANIVSGIHLDSSCLATYISGGSTTTVSSAGTGTKTGSSSTGSSSTGSSATTPVCKGKRIYIVKGSDNGKYIDGSFSYSPGDTLVLKSSANPYSYFSLEGIHGTATCPVTIMNEGGQVKFSNGMAFSDCSYIRVTGTGSADKYGFHIQDPSSDGVAVDIFGRSSNIEVNNVDIYHKTYGFWVKEEASCIDSLKYPNWTINHISIHDNRIVKTNQEGMYMGSTDPNGARGVSCSGKTIYPKPLRLGDIKVYNNIVDSTNRSGIQLSCASSGFNEIYNNQVSNCGFEFSTAQGNGISLGGYSHAYVHNNTISNTYALGILVLGAGPIQIDSNIILNSGKLAGHTVSGMDGIMVDTRYTIPADSSLLHIKNNKISGYTDYGVRFYATYWTYAKGNIVCNNTGTINILSGIDWTKDCTVSGARLESEDSDPSLPVSMQLYPNPVTDMLHVSFTGQISGNLAMNVYDVEGRLVQTTNVNKDASMQLETVDVSKLTPGFYIMQVIGEKQSMIAKFTKQ